MRKEIMGYDGSRGFFVNTDMTLDLKNAKNDNDLLKVLKMKNYAKKLRLSIIPKMRNGIRDITKPAPQENDEEKPQELGQNLEEKMEGVNLMPKVPIVISEEPLRDGALDNTEAKPKNPDAVSINLNSDEDSKEDLDEAENGESDVSDEESGDNDNDNLGEENENDDKSDDDDDEDSINKGKLVLKDRGNKKSEESIEEFENSSDLLNNKNQRSVMGNLSMTREGMVKTTVDLFADLSNSDIQVEFKGSLLADPHIRTSMFSKHSLNGIAKVELDSIKFFNGDVYYFQNKERGFMHSLGTLQKYKHVTWNGPENWQADYTRRNYYWSLFFSKIEFANFSDDYFNDTLKDKITYKKFSNLNKIMIKQSNGMRIRGTFLDCKLVGFANVRMMKPKAQRIKDARMAKESKEGEDKNVDEFWFYDRVHSEIKDRAIVNDFITLLQSKPLKAIEYKRKLYNLLRPLKEFYTKWSKEKMLGDEVNYFMIKFPNQFRKDKKQEFSIKYNERKYTSFSEIVENIYELKEGKYIIMYPNGDKFVGYKNNRLQFCGQGSYTWKAGYKYEGTFNLNIPLGEGRYIDCMGGKISGFFFKGFILKEGYGLLKLIDVYNKRIKRDTKHDLDIIFDPVVMKRAATVYIGKKVKYSKIFRDVMESRKQLVRRIQVVRDGEHRYTYDWDEKIRMDIINSLVQSQDQKLIKKVKQNLVEGKEFLEDKKKPKKSSKKNIFEKVGMDFVKSDSSSSDNSSSSSSVNENSSKSSMSSKKANSANSFKSGNRQIENMIDQKIERRYQWIKKINIRLIFVNSWQREQLVELVKDRDIVGVGIAFRYFLVSKQMNEFFSLYDEKKRNLLMVASYFGHMEIFSDLLGALRHCYKEKLITKAQIDKLFRKRDIEGNNIVDLACIRGYNVEEELMISKKLSKNQWVDSDNNSAMGSLRVPGGTDYGGNQFKLKNGKMLMRGNSVNPGDHDKKSRRKSFDLPQGSNMKKEETSVIPKKSVIRFKRKKLGLKLEPNPPRRIENKLSKDDWTANEAAKNDIFLPKLEKKDRHVGEKGDKDELSFDKKEAQRREVITEDSFDIELFRENFKRYNQSPWELFKTRVQSNTRIANTFKSVKKTSSSDIVFLSRRAACLNLYFAVCRLLEVENILKKDDYDLVLNNPLHYTIHKGDLHTTLVLLEEQNDIIFWRNEKHDVASQVIKYAGKNHARSLATFASILHEVTRLFNFSVISKLFIKRNEAGETSILSDHLNKLGIEGHRYKAEELLKDIERYKFVPKNNYLYQNNFILLSDELCLQYVEMLKDSCKVSSLKKEYTIFKYHVYSNVTIFEGLQRNFLDYYKGGIDRYHDKQTCSEIRSKVKRLLCWYVFIFGEVDINPQIYDLIGIDPFERILDGKNIFHFMCEYNSSDLLGEFLSHLYEKCHSEPYDRTRKTFEEWSLTLDKLKYQEMRRKFNIKTQENQQTPAHLCAINQSYDCLKLLLSHDIDIEEVNLRGRTVVEILRNSKRNREETLNVDKVESIDHQVFKMIKEDILLTCKRHSLIREFVPEADEKDFTKVFSQSKYELQGQLKYIRWKLRDRVGKYTEKYKSYLQEHDIIMQALNELVKVERQDTSKKMKYLSKCRRRYIRLNAKSKKKQSELDKINNQKELKMLEYLISSLSIKKLIIVPKEKIMMQLFNQNFLKKINHFKFKQIEKFIKIRLHKEILSHDFSQPIPSEFKYFTPKLGLFCVQVLIRENEEIEDNLVVKQIHNIKDKFRRFGGGIKIDMIKGFGVNVRTKKYLWMCKERFKSWFVVISVSHELLMKFAYEAQMGTYNMKNRYHTVFTEGSLEQNELEPLKHSQKMTIMMRLIKDEFDIKGNINRNLIVKYFPLHDYRLLNLIRKSWMENWFRIHFKDIFQKTTKSLTQFMSLISMYHGVQQGFYFGFLSVYTNSLFWLAIFGIASLVVRYLDQQRQSAINDGGIAYFQYVTAVAPFITGIWSTVFINNWRQREVELSYGFDVYEEENIKQVRDKYRGRAIISENTMKITKKAERRTFLMIFYNIASFIIGFGLIVLIYINVRRYNNMVDQDPSLSDMNKTAFLFIIGTVNGTLNFFLSVLYDKLMNYLVYTENHIYSKQYLDSLIMKKVTFKLISSLFTLFAQSLIERQTQAFISIQVTSNLLTSVSLNYGINVLIPVYSYYSRRFYIKSYLLTCGCCCKGRKKRGRLEKFKKDIIHKMLSKNHTKYSFKHYCLDGKIPEHLEKSLEKFSEKKKLKKQEMVNKVVTAIKEKPPGPQVESRINDVHPQRARIQLNASETSNLLLKNKLPPKPPSEEDLKAAKEAQKKKDLKLEMIFKNTLENLENVSENVYSFNPGPNSDLGMNKHDNIKLRLRENFTRYVLCKEKIIETSFMLDLETLEEGFYFSLLVQYSFICFFSPFLMAAGLISWFINIFIIVLTVLIYTGSTTRPISRRTKDIGIWNNIFNLVGYIGVLYNSVVIVRYSEGGSLFFDFGSKEGETEMIYLVQGGILIFKFLLSISSQNLPKWINDSIVREKIEKQRSIEHNSKVIQRLYNEAARKNKALEKDGTIDQSFFEGQEASDLRYFFKNENKITNRENLEFGDGINMNNAPNIKVNRVKVDD